MESIDQELLDLSPKQKVLVDSTAVAYKAQPGDHIAVPFGGTWFDGVYTGAWHHGVYAGINGDGEPFAIDMTGRSDEEANIKEVTLAKFRGQESVFAIVIYDGDTDAMKEATLKKARLALVTFKDHPGDLYNFIGSNCEHFATWCRTGRSEVHSNVESLEVPVLEAGPSKRCCMADGIRSKFARYSES